ncbi:two-component sensor histidine kinase [Cupriavidus gilardii]|nr:two-component sensor histidine kinase [Cupriavidus gilardii]
MRSLQGRLLAVMVGVIVLCWVVSLAALMVYLQHSRSSIWDDKLQAFAARIVRALPANKKAFNLVGPGREVRDDDGSPEFDLVIQIWSQRKLLTVQSPRPRAQASSPAAALKPDFVDGFATRVIDGERWRVYAISDSTGTMQAQVGIPHAIIDAEVREATMHALIANSVLLALVGVLLWHTMRRSLKPVAVLERLVRDRTTFDLTPLPSTSLPTELQPLVQSFNRVLAQLDQAVESERRFIGDAAHELRTPLSALQAQVEVAMRAPSGKEKDTALEKLLATAKRTTRLAEQLLDLARLNACGQAPHEPADLGNLVLHVASEFEVQAELQARQLSVETGGGCIACNVDEIGILLRNLVDNALRYTPPGGRIHVACGTANGGAGGAVYLEVADDGPGVPAAERQAIFRRFHRASGNRVRGSGIGLSLVATIAQSHGARIETGPGLDGRGFRVRVVFSPAEPMPPSALPAVSFPGGSEPVQVAHLHGGRVGAVDDRAVLDSRTQPRGADVQEQPVMARQAVIHAQARGEVDG